MLTEAVKGLLCYPSSVCSSPVANRKRAATFTYKYMKKHSETLMFLKKKNYIIPTFFSKADFVLQRNDFQLVEELF